MKATLTRAGWLSFALAACSLLGAQAIAKESLGLPPPAPVVDEYGLLSSGEKDQLDQLLRNAKQNSGVEIAVFIPSTLRGLEIEPFSIATAEEWKLGRKKEDKALLFTIAPKERKMRLEVGYGLEGQVTDVFSRQVLDDTMRPLFRQGRYFEGIVATLLRIQEKVPLGIDGQQAQSVATDQGSGAPPGGLHMLLIIFLVIFFLISSIFRAIFGRRRGFFGGGGWGGGGWGGGGFGGGGGSSWGGGGGGFGGGGSSSSW